MTVTLDDLRERAERSIPDKIRFKLSMWDFEKPSYEDWANLVEDAIDVSMREIAQRKNSFSESDEDTITSVVVIALRMLSFSAASEVVNGNCDLSISYGDYLWLGEAKIFTGLTAVWGGYLQLTQRYATGLPQHSRGGMLLYCKKDGANALLAEWRAALAAQVSHSATRDGRYVLSFASSDIVSTTGLGIDLMHFAFPLLHEPKEETLKMSKAALAAGKKAKEELKSEARDQ
jgi:hypothetical protein